LPPDELARSSRTGSGNPGATNVMRIGGKKRRRSLCWAIR